MTYKIRVFEDLLNLEVYSIGSHDAPNGFDVIEEFEVNGKVINLTVSGSLLRHLNNMRADARNTINNIEGFRSPEVIQEKWDKFDKELSSMRKGVASTILNLWLKQSGNT